jgi:hypothetical protein
MRGDNNLSLAAIYQCVKRVLPSLDPLDRRRFSQPPVSPLVPDVRNPFVWIVMIAPLGDACDLTPSHSSPHSEVGKNCLRNESITKYADPRIRRYVYLEKCLEPWKGQHLLLKKTNSCGIFRSLKYSGDLRHQFLAHGAALRNRTKCEVISLSEVLDCID